MRRIVPFVLVVALTACASMATRSVRNNVLTSRELPSTRITVDPRFRYVGKLPFTIAGLAAGHRYVFVDADGKQVKRLFVAQFEQWLPGIDETYRYDFDDARDLGGHKWRHNIGWYSQSALRTESSRGEATLMHDWLARKGYAVDDGLLMSRFLTLGNEDRKSELILFYIENAADNGVTIAELDADEARAAAFAEELEQRSLAAFRVER